MNREERRRALSKGASYKSVIDKSLSDEYNRGFRDGMKHVEDVVFYMTAYTIQYKLGFGNKRLCRIMNEIFNNIDSFRTGHLTKQDFETIKNEMNKLGVSLK